MNLNGALAPGNVNLTSEGTTDWAHWGLGSSSGFNHKTGITQQISNYTQIGSGTVGSFNDGFISYSWSDGTPTASATNNTSAIFIKGANRGFELNIPADTTQRTLKVYVGLYAAQGRFEASLSDSSATPVVDTSITNQTGTTNQVYTITYSAGSSGQNLKVRWTAIATFNSWGNVTLQGASLAGPSGPPVNQPPTVNAGADQSITLPASANLTGTASDDGLPNPPATLTTAWSQVSGPGTVTFGNANALSTTAGFSTAGTYTLRLTADDGSLTTTDDVIITASNQPPPNQAPTVNAGADQSITLPSSATLSGTASDDGLPNPPAILTTTWNKIAGPGTVAFGNANVLNTTASFSVAGTYTLRLTADDGSLASTDDVIITVSNPAPVNQPPTVNAGADQSITLPASANLTGTASDDGLPNPPATLTTTWSQVSGPGTVTFGNANALSTTAGFSTAGVYILRLTAGDSALSSTDDVQITVNNSGTIPGSLSVNGAAAPSNIDLTSEGTTDWAHWGLINAGSFNHKTGVTQQISNYTKIGSGTVSGFTDNSVHYSWSDGTPTVSATNSGGAIYIKGANRGFELNIPADTTQRTLKVYVGLYAAQGQFEASLSDSSATPVVDTSITNQTGTTNQVYTITYSAGSSGQNLKVRWTAIATFNSWGNVTLQGASLTGGGGGTPPPTSEFQISSSAPYGQYATHVAQNANGDCVVTWQSNLQDGNGWGIFARRYNSSGFPQGNEFQVNTYTLNDQFLPHVGIDAAGNFVIIWESENQDGSGYGVYGQRYNSAGVPLGGEFQINTYTQGNQHDPDMAMAPNGDFVVVWSSYLQDGSLDGIIGQRFNSAGAPQGTEFQINTYTNGLQAQPEVAMDANGNFVVGWESTGQDSSGLGVYGQRFNSAGVPQGNEFQINTFTTNDQFAQEPIMSPTGEFIFVWCSTAQDGSANGIFGQRYDAAGVPQGGEFQVNSFTAGNQTYPAVAIDNSNNFVVVWESQNQDGSGTGVYGQRFNAAGVKLGGEFQINTFTFNNQKNPYISKDGAGNFFVIWTSSGQDGSGDGVFGKRYDAIGNPLPIP
ncbi:MAG: hypothetical protein R2747_21430 [Pyrinomonadaceae bacterium]